MTAWLMEIPGAPMPLEYERHALRRLFWQEYGKDYDALPHGEVMEALLFRRLEKEHPHRFQPKKDE